MASRTTSLMYSYSRSWPLLVSRFSCCRAYSAEPQLIRTPVLSTSKTKMNVWKALHELNKSLSPVTLSKKVIMNLKIHKHAKASDLNQIFDSVMSLNHLIVAERALHEFRKYSSNLTRVSLPMIVVRAYIRLNEHYRLLDILKNKTEFGIFPSNNVYNILMDSFYIQNDLKGVLAAYKMIEKDNLYPNGDTYLILTHAYCDDSNEELLDKAIEMARLCISKFLKQGAFCYHRVIRTLLQRGDSEKARQLLDELVKKAPPKKLDVDIRLQFYLQLCDYSSAVKHIETIASSDNLPCPYSGHIRELEKALQQEEKTAELEKLKELVAKMEAQERPKCTGETKINATP